MAQAPALPRGFELPLEPRLPRIGSIDQVARRGARRVAREALDQEATSKLFALELAIRMMDLTTLEGADTPGKVAALCSKAVRPDPVDAPIPSVAASACTRTSSRTRRSGCAAAASRSRPSRRRSRPASRRLEMKLARRARGRRARRRRDRHGDRPRRVPLRPLREGLRRDRAGQGGVRRRRT